MRGTPLFIAAPIFAICVALSPFQRASAAVTAAARNQKTVKTYARVLRTINPHLQNWQSTNLAKHLLINARRWKIDANLLVALVTVESSWRTYAVSGAGALGLGQLMPGTARTLHVNAHDPYQNLQGAARYLHAMINKFASSPHQYSLAFAAYNAGPRAVTAFGGIPPYAETENYVVKVMRTWHTIARRVSAIAPQIANQTHIALKPAPKEKPAGNVAPDLTYWIGSKN